MIPVPLTNVEYITLRLIRRFLSPKLVQRLGRYLPYYRVNVSETDPEQTFTLYARWLAAAGRTIEGSQILEVGSGATNASGYALACAGARRVWCIEPYVGLEEDQDAQLLSRLSDKSGQDPSKIASVVIRATSFESISHASVDLIVSHSVLEHVSQLDALFAQMKAVMAAGGSMLHIVDYRDHFFKYPLHFLQFSARQWRRFLDPGDLPRWRLSDHRARLAAAGFEVEVIWREHDAVEFQRIRPHISRDFDLADPDLGVLRAVLLCRHPAGEAGPNTATPLRSQHRS